jgi:hypothetical protein
MTLICCDGLDHWIGPRRYFGFGIALLGVGWIKWGIWKGGVLNNLKSTCFAPL